jgi:macrolide transport system ATP-binding/permease protein
MAALTVLNLAKAYGDTTVLNSLTFIVNEGEKVGLVGANGTGKSTVLKVIVGEVVPDVGSVVLDPNVTIGYLPQALQNADDLTIAESIDAARGDLSRIARCMRESEAALTLPGDHAALLAEYAMLSEEFERRGGYSTYEVDQVLDGLGLSLIERTRTVESLSGGEKSRLGLASLLLRSPDLLLLDEPTNHLDVDALAWLEQYLQAWRGALLVVSHDREFLDHTVTQIVEIDEHTRDGKVYAGNYSAYAAAREQERARWAADYEAQQEEIRELKHIIRTRGRQVAHNRGPRDNDGFIYAFKGSRVDSAVARNLRNAEERLARIETDPVPRPPILMVINPAFDPEVFGSKTPLSADDLFKAWGERQILAGVSASIGAHARIVITGPNGSGKSTLLKILAGALTPDLGRVSRAPGVVVGYLDQEQETLPSGATVYQAWAEGLTGDFETLKSELLSYGLFTWPELLRSTEVLSTGQKRKLQIARLLAVRANLLLLDEPTNHLSFDVLEQFEQALRDFPGPIVAISHDRRFFENFAEEQWEIDGGRLHRTLRSLPTR